MNYAARYSQLVRELLETHPLDEAMALAIGGEFSTFGVLMRDILIHAGLQSDHYLIDVGCGAGRLSSALDSYLRGSYLGTDIIPELLEYARKLADRRDWRFEVVTDLVIPEEDGRADMVCFFSVFTHLLHEHSYRYLLEARRVLKPGGGVVFSFLEFLIPCHWPIFEGMVAGRNRAHDQFISRDAIRCWAEHSGFGVVAIHDGDKPLPVTPARALGQSVCILEVR